MTEILENIFTACDLEAIKSAKQFYKFRLRVIASHHWFAAAAVAAILAAVSEIFAAFIVAAIAVATVIDLQKLQLYLE